MDNLKVSCRSRIVEWRKSSDVLPSTMIDISSSLEKEPHYFEVAVVARFVEGGPTRVVQHINIATLKREKQTSFGQKKY